MYNFTEISSFKPLKGKLFTTTYLKCKVGAQFLYKFNLSKSSRIYKREKIEVENRNKISTKPPFFSCRKSEKHTHFTLIRKHISFNIDNDEIFRCCLGYLRYRNYQIYA